MMPGPEPISLSPLGGERVREGGCSSQVAIDSRTLQGPITHEILRSMRFPLIVVVCVMGCFGQTFSDSLEPLAETAWTQRIYGLECDRQMTFYMDGQYLEAIVCFFPDNSQGAQVDQGTYHVNGPTLTVSIDQTSCPTNHSGSVEFALNGDMLTLYPSGGIIMLLQTAFTPGEPQGIPFGCFDEIWKFTPMAIHPI
jgi:hypothetical protein